MENPYRSAPPPAVAHWRDYGGLALAGALLLSFNVVPLLLHRTVALSCDRAVDACHLDVGSPVKSSSETVALADLTQVRAQGFQHKYDRQTTVADVEVILIIKGKERHLPASGEKDDRVRFAEQAESFLQSPTQSQLSVAYGKFHDFKDNFGIPLVTGAILLAIVFLSPYVRIVGDRAAGKLIFERRPFGRLFVHRSEFPLDAVVRAEVDGHSPGRGKSSYVMLVLSGGGRVSPGGWASSSTGAAGPLCHRINEVLRSARA
jgi:hypothetical protein